MSQTVGPNFLIYLCLKLEELVETYRDLYLYTYINTK